jgi:hypothetical protein
VLHNAFAPTHHRLHCNIQRFSYFYNTGLCHQKIQINHYNTSSTVTCTKPQYLLREGAKQIIRSQLNHTSPSSSQAKAQSGSFFPSSFLYFLHFEYANHTRLGRSRWPPRSSGSWWIKQSLTTCFNSSSLKRPFNGFASRYAIFWFGKFDITVRQWIVNPSM